jgi:glycerophosphoryl diester phosphodiesterase
MDPADIEFVATYAQGMGPSKSMLVDSGVKLSDAIAFVESSHELGLVLHPYTFRTDSSILKTFDGDYITEEKYFYCCLGVDALFNEQPDVIRQVIDELNLSGFSSDNPNPSEKCGIDCTAYQTP